MLVTMEEKFLIHGLEEDEVEVRVDDGDGSLGGAMVAEKKRKENLWSTSRQPLWRGERAYATAREI